VGARPQHVGGAYHSIGEQLAKCPPPAQERREHGGSYLEIVKSGEPVSGAVGAVLSVRGCANIFMRRSLGFSGLCKTIFAQASLLVITGGPDATGHIFRAIDN
jgi:hypothetical protein